MGCLLIRKGKFDHICIAVGSPKEGNAHREIISGETGRHGNRRDVDQKCVEVRRSLHIDIRRIHPFADECRLMFSGLMDDRVKTVVSHGLQEIYH